MGHAITYTPIGLLGKLMGFFVVVNVVLVSVTYVYELFSYFLLGAYTVGIVSR